MVKLEEDIRVEHVVIGGGLMGLLCAACLKERGKEVIVLEAEETKKIEKEVSLAMLEHQAKKMYHERKKRYGTEDAKIYAGACEKAIRSYRQILEREGLDESFLLQDLIDGLKEGLVIYEHTKVIEVDDYMILTKQNVLVADHVIFALKDPSSLTPGVRVPGKKTDTRTVLAGVGREREHWYMAYGIRKWDLLSAMIAADIIVDALCGKENSHAVIFTPHELWIKKKIRKIFR